MSAMPARVSGVNGCLSNALTSVVVRVMPSVPQGLLLLLQYMVKRKGLDFTEYGLVDARAAKRQRLTGDNNDPKYAV